MLGNYGTMTNFSLFGEPPCIRNFQFHPVHKMFANIAKPIYTKSKNSFNL